MLSQRFVNSPLHSVVWSRGEASHHAPAGLLWALPVTHRPGPTTLWVCRPLKVTLLLYHGQILLRCTFDTLPKLPSVLETAKLLLFHFFKLHRSLWTLCLTEDRSLSLRSGRCFAGQSVCWSASSQAITPSPQADGASEPGLGVCSVLCFRQASRLLIFPGLSICTQLRGQFCHRCITIHGSLWLPASLDSRAGSWCGISVQSSTTCRRITRFGRLPALPSSALLRGTNAWRTDAAHQPLPMSRVKRFGSLQRIFPSKQTIIS